MIVDAHQDIAYSAWALQRDLRQSALITRAREAATQPAQTEEFCTVGLPELRAGGVGLMTGSIFLEPSHSSSARAGYVYSTAEEAHHQAHGQVDYYHRLAASGDVLLVRSRADLDELERMRKTTPVVGLLMGMEGADPVRSPDDVAMWWERGVRQIGLAWAYGSQYCGGNKAPGPLAPQARPLLAQMQAVGMTLDVSHLAEESFWQALKLFGGRIIASHANCRALVPGERQLSDEMIRAIVARGGVIGVVLYNTFLQAGWTLERGKEAVTLAHVVRHIDHMCQIAGDARHVGIGSDLDGGFGREATPAEIDTVADVHLLGAALASAGYAPADVKDIMGGNWLRFLRAALPQSD